MADWYVWNGAASPTPNYTTWDTAAALLQTVTTLASAGDTIYVASDHVETNAGQNIVFTNATQANPIMVLCGTRTGTTGTGISALNTGAQVKSSNSTFGTSGGPAYIYGIHFHADLTGSGTNMTLGSGSASSHTFESCQFFQNNTSPSSLFTFGNGGGATSVAQNVLKNCAFKGQGSAQSIYVNGYLEVRGLSFVSGNTMWSNIFTMGIGNRGAVLEASGIDCTNIGGTSFNFCLVNGTVQKALIRNVKIPASWSGSPGTAPTGGSTTFELWNYNIGTTDKNYKYWLVSSFGTVKDDDTVYLSAGASDESSVHYSMKMTSTANVGYPAHPLRSPPIIQRLASIGTLKTVTVEIAYDGASALTDKQVWLEMEYLGNSGFSLASYGSDIALPTASPVAQTSSSAAWTGFTNGVTTGPNGSTTWNKQKLEVAFTPQEVGYYALRVCLGKNNTAMTIYSDWKASVA